MEVVMGARKMLFPIALAILWVLLAAMAMADFASFTATTQPRHSQQMVRGRASVRVGRN